MLLSHKQVEVMMGRSIGLGNKEPMWQEVKKKNLSKLAWGATIYYGLNIFF